MTIAITIDTARRHDAVIFHALSDICLFRAFIVGQTPPFSTISSS